MNCPYCKEGFMIDVGLYPIIKCNSCGKVKIDYQEELFKKRGKDVHNVSLPVL
jgi:uncharacterized protein (DUF983 family)